MSKYTILVTIYILSCVYCVTCDDVEEVKRFGLNRARQGYRFNHPPSFENQENIPVAVQYDKVVDRTTRRQKTVIPATEGEPKVSVPVVEETLGVQNVTKYEFGDKIKTTQTTSEPAIISVDDINKPQPREIKLTLKIPVSVVYDEKSEIENKNKVKSGIATRIRRPLKRLRKPSIESDETTASRVKSLNNNNEYINAVAKPVHNIFDEASLELKTETNIPKVSIEKSTIDKSKFSVSDANRPGVLAEYDTKAVNNISERKASSDPSQRQVETSNIEISKPKVHENNSRRRLQTQKPETYIPKASTESSAQNVYKQVTETATSNLDLSNLNIPIVNGNDKSAVKTVNNEENLLFYPIQTENPKIKLSRSRNPANNSKRRSQTKTFENKIGNVLTENIAQVLSTPKTNNSNLPTKSTNAKLHQVKDPKIEINRSKTPSSSSNRQSQIANSETDKSKVFTDNVAQKILKQVKQTDTSNTKTNSSETSNSNITVENGNHEKLTKIVLIKSNSSEVSTENDLHKKRRHGEPDPIVPIVTSENRVYGNTGEFQYSYESGDGTRAFSKGNLRTFDEDVAGEAVEGGFSYKGKDGNDYSLSYTADENGYRPIGAHLPTPPPIPPAIARALAYLATKTTPEPVTEAINDQENTPDTNQENN